MVNIETSATNPLDNTAEFNEAKLKHAFQYNEQVLINSQIRVDRLDVEGTRKRFDWQGLSEERLIPANERAETYYQVIRETNSLVSASSGENLPDNGQNHSEAITSERIGYDLALLGGFYRRSLTTGLLTAYKLPDREIYEKTLKQIEDPVAHKRQEDYLKATYKSEIDARRRSGLAKEPVPGLLERTPVGLSDQDIESLLGEGEDVRREALAELLDPYRNRPDHGASQEEKEKAVEARLQVGVLLESLNPSWQRDLLAADTWRFYMHETINDQERANKAINLVSPNLRNSLLSLHEYLKTTTPESIVAGYKGQSERTLANLAIRTETDPQHLRAEAENEKNSMRVSINIGKSEPLTTVFKFLLQDYRLLSAHEIPDDSGTQTAGERQQLETRNGLDPLNIKMDKPISGTLNLEQNEITHGDKLSRHYGKATIVLKPEVARERCLYFLADSARTGMHLNKDGSKEKNVMTFEDAAAAKLVHDSQRATNPSSEYIEALVIGGVTADDVESITIPYANLDKYGGMYVLATKYPDIQFNLTVNTDAASSKTVVDEATSALRKYKNVNIVLDYDELEKAA